MKNFATCLGTLAFAGLLTTGCSDDAAPSAPPPATGTLHSALVFMGTTHDVDAMAYKVVAADADCADGEVIDEAVSVIEEEALPGFVAGDAGQNHAFADALFVLQPGDYKVCVTPIQEDGTPSAICAPTEGVFTVVAEQTTEGILYSQCLGDPSGGLDVITALNDPPHIDDLDIAASKFITTCESATIAVSASDPDGDTLSYVFEVLAGPPGAQTSLAWQDNVAVFSADIEGTYTLQVTVSDGLGGEAHLSFPIHVSDGGACGDDCAATCDALGESVRNTCLQLIGQFPVDPVEFCDFALGLVTQNCNALFCDGPQGECAETCQQLAQQSLDQCLPVSPDPILCEGGAQIIEQACLVAFACPPPEPPCEVQCLGDAQAAFDACLQAPPPEPICGGAQNPGLQDCFVAAQGQLNACLYADDGCFPPGQRECGVECGAQAAAAIVECAGEPSCQDPGACQIRGQPAEQACQQQCCYDDCLQNECGPQCGGDPACLEQCAAVACAPRCFPEVPCEQTCADSANQVIADCLGNLPPEPICDNPGNECLARGYDAFAACLEGQCGGDACAARCVQGCITDCNDPNACQEDPALTAECQQACIPDPNECPDRCGQEFETCLAVRDDPIFCEQVLEGCLAECPAPPPPPPCEVTCEEALRACVDAGNPPDLCDDEFQQCLGGCNPPTCEGICQDDFIACIEAGVDPLECEAGAEACLVGCNLPPSCEASCEADVRACFEAGIDPAECDQLFAACLDGCNPPPPPQCQDACALRFEDCLSAGVPPLFCQVEFDDCLQSCGP